MATFNDPQASKDATEKFKISAAASKVRNVKFTTVSGEPVELLYTPEDVKEINYLSDIGYPGEFPYTRGIHNTGYRGKLWTMRQFAGFG